MTTTVDVEVLKQMWRVVRAGGFDPRGQAPVLAGDRPDALARVVVGVAGGVGASTVALALAEVTGAERLWDAAPTVASGLVGVCDRELGVTEDGWQQGLRGELLVQRSPLTWSSTPGECPAPPAGGSAVLDAGWDALSLHGASGWPAAALADPGTPLVLVAQCTVPSLRRLAVVLHAVQDDQRDIRVAITRLEHKRWPRDVPPPVALTHLQQAGHVTFIPDVRALATRGLDSQPLPPAVLAAVKNLHQ
jgi:hypothetical protein